MMNEWRGKKGTKKGKEKGKKKGTKKVKANIIRKLIDLGSLLSGLETTWPALYTDCIV